MGEVALLKILPANHSNEEEMNMSLLPHNTCHSPVPLCGDAAGQVARTAEGEMETHSSRSSQSSRPLSTPLDFQKRDTEVSWRHANTPQLTPDLDFIDVGLEHKELRF